MYDHGKGFAKNHTTAVAWFRKAADQGHAEALNNLGLRGCAGGGRVRGNGGLRNTEKLTSKQTRGGLGRIRPPAPLRRAS